MSDALGDAHLLRYPVARGDARRPAIQDAVSALFEQWHPALLKYVYTFGLSDHDGEEVVQEVFLALFSHLRRDKSQSNLNGWLFRVAHNLALKRRTRSRREADRARDNVDQIGRLQHPAMNPEEELALSQRQQRFSSILDALPEQDRRCLYLRAEDLRYREIAEILGISLGSVASSLQRSLARFQRAGQR